MYIRRSQTNAPKKKLKKFNLRLHFSVKNVYTSTYSMKRDHASDESPPKRPQWSFLKICLPNEYNNILPDLVLFDIDSVEYIRSVDKLSSYLYYMLSCA